MFTKKDLKNGMVVETRDGMRYMVVGDRLIGYDGFLRLTDYSNDLYDTDNIYETKGDIMMVFDVVSELQIEVVDGPPLFDRNCVRASSKNNDKTKYMCKELAKIYSLDESKLYNQFLRILYDASCSTIPITEFNIEKCSEDVINKAICELGKECSTYCLIKKAERD